MNKKTDERHMGLHELLEWANSKIYELKDAAFGSFVYFLYGHFYQRRDIYKGLAAFFIGTIFAVYVSPLFQSWTGWSVQIVSFLTGLLGMRLTQAIINQDYKGVLKEKIEVLKGKVTTTTTTKK
jgi:hypothetical protein